MPFTFCLADKDANILLVTLYNLSPGRGVIIGNLKKNIIKEISFEIICYVIYELIIYIYVR